MYQKQLLILFLQAHFISIVKGFCDHELTADDGTIQSPHYPSQYQPDTSCVWTITVKEGHYVKLSFLDFDVEPYDGCKTDMLEIKDGGSKNSAMIGGQYCNLRRPPKVVTSTGNQLRLWFSSDSTIQYRGFKATYQAIKDEGCGKVDEIPGFLSSPRYPFAYPNNIDCQWDIVAPAGRYISLEFTAFQLESSCSSNEGCKCNDYILVKDHVTGETIEYCMSSPARMVSKGNKLTIKFHSDSYGRLNGFKVSISQSSTKQCGGDIYSEDGVIKSPNFNLMTDATYPPFSYCIWTIHTKKNSYLSLKFQYFDVAGNIPGSCDTDYLLIHDGPNQTFPSLGRYCNRFKPNVIVSSAESIFIQFASGGYSLRKGFKIFFQTHTKSCSSSLGMEDGRIHNMDLQTSSNFIIAHSPHALGPNFGRLNSKYAWCSQEQKFKMVGEYFEVAFDKYTRISSIATQGYTMVGNEYFVTKYKLLYATTSKEWHHFVSTGDSDAQYNEFEGNKHFNVTKKNKLSPNIVVKKLRLVPLDFQSGRRKHICLRMEVYGCPVEEEIEIVSNPNKVLSFSSKKKTSKTWLIAPQQSNGVYVIKTKKLESECSLSSLSYSNDGLQFSKPICNGLRSSKTEKIQVFPNNRQLWIKFDVTGLLTKSQSVQLSTFSLGHGRVISSFLGKIRLLHNQVAKDSSPSVWLFFFPDGYRIKLDFINIQLPTGFEKPTIVLKSGAEEDSKIVRRIQGKEGHWAFIYPRNTLRVEYHPGRGSRDSFVKGENNDGFTLEYAALKN
ncbi:neuropilin-1a-like [Clytia hemisphaerica]|uniref:Uncharacterized protein n=1 Tax=Clytia hemisphaerica TaxID=252671 RepID=A0A7M5VE55_9CNID